MKTRGMLSKRQKIQNVLADKERPESTDAGGGGKSNGTRKKPLSSQTNLVTKVPTKATNKKAKGGPAKGGPEIVKVVRPPIVVAHQQQKKARRNQAAAIDQAPTECDPTTQRCDNHGGQQRDYHNNGHQNGLMGDEEDGVAPMGQEGGVHQLSESEIRQLQHEQHQKNRAKRSKHQKKNRLSRRTRNKIVNRCIEENGAELRNNIIYVENDYSPIKPVCMHNSHFSPNPGSPPLQYDSPDEFLQYFCEEEEEEEEEEEGEDEEEEEEGYDEEDEEEDYDEELNWYANRFYTDS